MPNSAQHPKPLVVDADGTLLATDMLVECFWAALGKNPLQCLGICAVNLRNRARLKQELAKIAGLDVASLPQNPEVIALCTKARAEGRQVIIASGADQSLVAQLSSNLGFVDDYLASDGETNLTSTRKAKALKARFGQAGFDYIGDSRADIAVWQVADQAIVVAPAKRLLAKIGRPVQTIGKPAKPKDIFRAFRPHQWVKNLLLFLPLLAAHRSDLTGVLLAFWGVFVFSAAASSIYIVNDLLDLAADRKHKTKRNRPFASGAVPLQTGMVAGVGLGALALGISAWHSVGLLAIVALYMTLSLAYSMVLKRLRWVDVATLATLYTLRVVAGAFAVNVDMSGWLAIFVFPIFLALGCVKRLVELGKITNENQLPGRGYARHHRGDLLAFAITASLGAVVVFGLYTFTATAQVLYSNPVMMRFAVVFIAAWLARMISRGWQGRMDYDPIVFALRDPLGLALIFAAGVLVFYADS